MRRLEAIVRPTSMKCRRVWWRISKALAVTCFAGERIRASPGFGGRSGLFFDGDIRKEHGCRCIGLMCADGKPDQHRVLEGHFRVCDFDGFGVALAKVHVHFDAGAVQRRALSRQAGPARAGSG